MIYIKSEKEIDFMRIAGRILADTLDLVESLIEPGIKTKQLDKAAYDFIKSQGAEPSFLGLYDYPATINASVNEEVIHGIPGERVLREGDIISIDAGVFKNGFHSDAARTFAVGKISEEAARIVRITRESFYKAIEKCRIGNRLSDISNAVQVHIESHGYGVVREFTGHGIGQKVHEDPPVPNYGRPGRGPRLEAGMAVAIEPMVTQGHYKVITLSDGWTVVTADKKLSAHYENTVVITENGPEILTLTEAERALELMGDIIRA